MAKLKDICLDHFCLNELYIIFSDHETYGKWKSLFETNKIYYYIPKLDKICIGDYYSAEFIDEKLTIELVYETDRVPNIKSLKLIYDAISKEDPHLNFYCYYENDSLKTRGIFDNGKESHGVMDYLYYITIQGQLYRGSDFKIIKNDKTNIIHFSDGKLESFFLIKEKTDMRGYDLEFIKEMDYVVYKCFSDVFGEDVEIMEYNGQLYFNKAVYNKALNL